MTTNYKEFKTVIGGREVVVETGKYAEQTNGMCVVRCGETAVMVTVCMSAQPREGMDFFPLQVDYEEKMFAVGKIPGGFKRREGRASDKAILTARLIDRPLRPLFPKGLFNDVVVIATALSVEPDIAPEPLAMIGSSIALAISDIPLPAPLCHRPCFPPPGSHSRFPPIRSPGHAHFLCTAPLPSSARRPTYSQSPCTSGAGNPCTHSWQSSADTLSGCVHGNSPHTG